MDNEAIEFAYKYPFSEEAKALIESLGINRINPEHLKLGTIEVENALNGQNPEYTKTSYNEIKSAYVISYVYARMIASSLGMYAVKKLAAFEAERSYAAMMEESEENIMHLSEELGVHISKGTYTGHTYFEMPFYEYIEISKRDDSISLVHQMLSNGKVILDKPALAKSLRIRIMDKMLENMPIPQKSIPKEVVNASKSISKIALETVANQPVASVQSGRYAWIERLLNTPLPDFRHRIVNIVLAPYLVNVKRLSEEQAAEIISKYIERCKELNPNTNITESYIKYQCSYSKKRGLKPLSLKRAKELLGDMFGDTK
ncbi:MAG: DNA primase noncatalytic subunit PriX [Candidatus Micrarchaeaceae archaeon]